MWEYALVGVTIPRWEHTGQIFVELANNPCHRAFIARRVVAGHTFPLAVARAEPLVGGRVGPVLAARGIEKCLQRDPLFRGFGWLGIRENI